LTEPITKASRNLHTQMNIWSSFTHPFCFSKPVWPYLFCGTQNNISWTMSLCFCSIWNTN